MVRFVVLRGASKRVEWFQQVVIPADLQRFDGNHDGLDRNHSAILSAACRMQATSRIENDDIFRGIDDPDRQRVDRQLDFHSVRRCSSTTSSLARRAWRRQSLAAAGVAGHVPRKALLMTFCGMRGRPRRAVAERDFRWHWRSSFPALALLGGRSP